MSDEHIHELGLPRRAFLKRAAAAAFAAPVVVSFALDGVAEAHQSVPNQTQPNQTKPNQSCPNQSHPNQTCANQTFPNQFHKHHRHHKDDDDDAGILTVV